MRKFSVVVPVYNVAPWLRACLDSIVVAKNKLHEHANQEIGAWGVEIICVDDGSTDESPIILDNYKQNLINFENGRFSFKVIHQKNMGLSGARNTGLERVTGRYVSFVDSDDTVLPEYFICLAECLQEDVDILRFGYKRVNSHDEVVEYHKGDTAFFDTIDSESAYNAYLAMSSIIACAACFLVSSIRDVKFVERLQPGEDVVFTTRAFINSRKVGLTSTILYKYLQRDGSIMNNKKFSATYFLNHMRATLYIYESLKTWHAYSRVAGRVFVSMRTSFIGQCGLAMQNAYKSDCREIWNNYFITGRLIFCDKECQLPKFFGFMYRLVFRLENKILWRIFLFTPWRIRAWLNTFRLITCVKTFLRTYK